MAGMHIDISKRSVALDPCDPVFYQNPYPAYQAIRAAMPVFKWEDYGHWCFARYDDVTALLRDRRFGRQVTHVTPEHLKSFYDFEQHSLLELDPPDHTRLRGLINRSFLARRIECLRPAIVNLSNSLIDAFEARGEAEIIADFATPVAVTVICDFLGVPREMAQQALAWSHDMVAVYQARRDREIEDAAARATVAFSEYVRGLIVQRRMEPRDDLLSDLTRMQKLSEDELVTMAILLLNAGHEATVHAIGNGVKALVESGITENIGEGHVEEILRFDTPLHLFTRYALEDLEYAGIKFRKGEEAGLMLGAANRDPARFTDPDRFDAARDPNPHLSFGAGIHFCVGAPLARLEMQVALPILFRRLPRLALAETPRYRNTYHFHGLERLKVTF